MLADPDGSCAREFGIWNEEKRYPGRVTFYIGKDGKLLYVDREVKVSTAGPDVAARLQALGVARKSPEPARGAP